MMNKLGWRPTRTIASAVTGIVVMMVTLLAFMLEEEGVLKGQHPLWGFLRQPADTPLTPATLVTSYYPISKGAKHSLQDYRKWMGSFLPHVKAPLVVYLPPDDPQIETVVRELRGDLPLQIIKVHTWVGDLELVHVPSSMPDDPLLT